MTEVSVVSPPLLGLINLESKSGLTLVRKHLAARAHVFSRKKITDRGRERHQGMSVFSHEKIVSR